MANKTIDALVFCPFYVREARTTITCEGIIGSVTVNRFNTEREKVEHENNFCTGKTCLGCGVHSALSGNYPSVPGLSGRTYRC